MPHRPPFFHAFYSRSSSRAWKRTAAGVVAGALAATVMSAAGPISATGNAIPEDAAALYAEVMNAALYTAGEARMGYAAESYISDTIRGESGPPRLEVDTQMAVDNLTSTAPKIAVQRTVRSYGERVDTDPYRNETWGGVGTGAYGSAGTTQAWIAVPENVGPASADLLAATGNPSRIVARALASTDLSPRNRPHSVIEAEKWAEHNSAVPWGPLLYLSSNWWLQVSKAEKETFSDGTRKYTLTWAPKYSGTLVSTFYVTKDGILGLARVKATFPAEMGMPATEVEHEVRLTWLGRNAPMPGPSLTEEVRRGSAFARRAAAHAIAPIVAHANRALRAYAQEQNTTITPKTLPSLVEGLANEKVRWAAMSDERAAQDLNMWVDRYRIVLDPETRAVVLTVNAEVLQHQGVCEVSLAAIGDGVGLAMEPVCDLIPLPVLGVGAPPEGDDEIAPLQSATVRPMAVDAGRPWGAFVRLPEAAAGAASGQAGAVSPGSSLPDYSYLP